MSASFLVCCYAIIFTYFLLYDAVLQYACQHQQTYCPMGPHPCPAYKFPLYLPYVGYPAWLCGLLQSGFAKDLPLENVVLLFAPLTIYVLFLVVLNFVARQLPREHMMLPARRFGVLVRGALVQAERGVGMLLDAPDARQPRLPLPPPSPVFQRESRPVPSQVPPYNQPIMLPPPSATESTQKSCSVRGCSTHHGSSDRQEVLQSYQAPVSPQVPKKRNCVQERHNEYVGRYHKKQD